MAAPPDNNVLLKEIKSIHIRVDDMDDRLREVEQWKIATMAAEAAIARYKQENPPPISERQNIFGEGINREVVKLIVQALAIIGSLVALLTWVVQYFLQL